MRDKKMAKRIAVAILAAATTFSSVPATAVFAAETSAVASDMKISDSVSTSTDTWTVNGTAKADLDSTADAEKLAVGNALDGADLSKITKDADAIATLQTAVDSVKASTYVVKSTTLISGAGNGNVVVETADGDTLTYVFTTATAMKADETAALDTLFDGMTIKTYDGKTANTASVQSALNAALTTAKADPTNTFFGTSKTGNSYTYTVNSATVANGYVTGTITRKDGSTTYTYSYTASVEQSSDSKTAIVDSAVSALAATEIPDAGSAANTLKYIQGVLNAELSDQGITVTLAQAKNDKTDLYTAAKHGKTGSIVVFVDKASNPNAAVTFTLKESSTQKLTEADAKLAGTKGIFKTKGTAALYLLDDAGNTQSSSTDTGVYTIADTSALARSIQAKGATTAAGKDAVVAGIKNAVADAVKDYDGDGVEYKTEIVSNKYIIGDTDKGTAAKYLADAQDATVDKPGAYLVKVTASIANDFFDSSKAENATTNPSTSTNTYYVLVNTSMLNEVKTTKIALSDMTVAYKEDTHFAGSTDANADKDSMTISLKPTLTPADSNSKITWTVTGKSADGKTTYTKDTDFKFDAATYGTDAAKLVVKKAGTYKVTATYKGLKAEATVTVRANFKDVSADAYYAKAVDAAYSKGITAGKTADTFGVNDSVTRAQFITWLYKLAVSKDSTQAIADADVKAQFSDVATGKYYAKAVQWAVANGITAGTSKTTFSPNATITRAQAVTMLWNYVGKADTGAKGSEDDLTKRFTDLPANKTFAAAITWAVNNHITSGTTLTTFSPNANATRAQGITFIYNAGLLK